MHDFDTVPERQAVAGGAAGVVPDVEAGGGGGEQARVGGQHPGRGPVQHAAGGDAQQHVRGGVPRQALHRTAQPAQRRRLHGRGTQESPGEQLQQGALR